MARYKVIRICFVEATSKREALEKVQANAAKHFNSEFAVEVKETGWLGSVRKQLLGARK